MVSPPSLAIRTHLLIAHFPSCVLCRTSPTLCSLPYNWNDCRISRVSSLYRPLVYKMIIFTVFFVVLSGLTFLPGSDYSGCSVYSLHVPVAYSLAYFLGFFRVTPWPKLSIPYLSLSSAGKSFSLNPQKPSLLALALHAAIGGCLFPKLRSSNGYQGYIRIPISYPWSFRALSSLLPQIFEVLCPRWE